MSAGFTPGPWEFVDNALVGPKIDDKPIWLRPVILRSEVGVNQYDARLIACAPELLEELENCLDLLVTCFSDAPANSCMGVAITKARAAIKKATGETT